MSILTHSHCASRQSAGVILSCSAFCGAKEDFIYHFSRGECNPANNMVDAYLALVLNVLDQFDAPLFRLVWQIQPSKAIHFEQVA